MKERSAVLEDFFRNRKDEIKKMTHLDYTWEKREKLIRKEEYEEGITQGVSQARKDVLLRMIARGDSREQILELGYSEDEYHQVIQ